MDYSGLLGNVGSFGSYDGDEEGLWLHCVRYTGPDWSYRCSYPDWAYLDSVPTKKMKS